MGVLLSSSPTPSALAPVYSGVDKLVSIFDGNGELSSYGKWKDVLAILIDALFQSPSTDNCYVSAMHIYKESIALPFHEMLLFEIVSDKPGSPPFFMRVDRFVSNPNISMFSASASTLPDEKEKDLNACHAEHQSQISLTDACVEPTFIRALSAFFDPHTACFRRLLDLLKIVSTQFAEYNLWDRSCYWFSSVVYRTYIMAYPPSSELQGKAYPNLGKLTKTGRGVDWLSPYLDDQGKLYDTWQASRSKFIPIARFLCKEKGRGSIVFDRTRNQFVVRTRIGMEFVVFSSQGLLGDDRIQHIAKGVHVADLNGRLINCTSHGSSSVDLRFKSREEAQMVFEAMRRLMHGRSITLSPVKVLVDRRHTSLMIAQKDDGPAYLECSSRTTSSRPNLKLFKPLHFSSSSSSPTSTSPITSTLPQVESYNPLQLVWRDYDKDLSLLWRQEYILETSHTTRNPRAELDLWTEYWQDLFQWQSPGGMW